MCLLRHGSDHFVHIIRDRGAFGPLGFHFHGLFLGRHFADQQKVVQAAHQGQFAAAGLGQLLEHLRDVHAPEEDPVCRVHKGDIGQQRLDIAHAANNLSHGHIVHLHIAMFLGK